MYIHISSNNGIPIYLQIVQQIQYLVASKRLRPGDEVPPIRTLAEQLLINPNTVARAYRELEQSGVLTKRRGAGTYVAEGESPLSAEARRKVLAERADALVVEAGQLGFSIDEVLALVAEREEALRRGEQGEKK